VQFRIVLDAIDGVFAGRMKVKLDQLIFAGDGPAELPGGRRTARSVRRGEATPVQRADGRGWIVAPGSLA